MSLTLLFRSLVVLLLLVASIALYWANVEHPLIIREEEKTGEKLSSRKGTISSLVVDRNHRKNMTRHKAKFVFTMGLEGTGHHLLKTLYSDSPHVKRLKALGQHPEITQQIARLLWDKDADSIFIAWERQALRGDSSGSRIQLADLQKKLANLMVSVHDTIPDDEPNQIMVPVNALTARKGIGQMSYPSMGGDYRYLQHPNLNLFYQACDIAGVECGHIYLYRNPYSILKSTTINRHYNNNELEAMQLYETDLAVLTAQLLDYPEQTEACLGFYESEAAKLDSPMWNTVQNLLGWNGQQTKKFRSYIGKVFRPPQQVSEETKASLVPPEWEPAMQSWLKSHERTIELCRRNVASSSGQHHQSNSAKDDNDDDDDSEDTE